jgi:lipopolysaccharide/colanic/teichoic acid biosynthesis glycosyltransferase
VTLLGIILLPLIIALKLTGEGEILYKQKRVGYLNRPFYVYKFATMLKNSLNMGTGVVTLDNDPRFTPLGKFLRKSKINELPQLVNVLLGDMSFVGPRPLLKQQSFDFYPQEVQEKIYKSKPGITGIGSLVMRDEERILADIHSQGSDPHVFYQKTLYPYKGQLELFYQKHRGFWTDIKILLATALAIIAPRTDWAKVFFKNLPVRPDSLKIT